MRLSVETKALASALATVGRAAKPGGYMFITGCVLLEAEGDRLRLECTDLDLTISTSVAADVGMPGRACLPVRVVEGLVQGLTGDRVDLAWDGKKLGIRCGGHRSSVNGVDPKDWPERQSAPDALARVGAKALAEGLAQTLFAIAHEDSRPSLGGILFELGRDGLVLVSADGFRAARKALAYQPLLARDEGKPLRLILPRRAAGELAHLLTGADAQVDLRAHRAGATVTALAFALGDPGGTTISGRLVEAQYPAVERIIPTQRDCRLSLEAARVAGLVRTLAVVADSIASTDRNNLQWKPVRVEAQPGAEGSALGKVSLSSRGVKLGEASEELVCPVEGQAVRTGFDARYLVEALSAIPTEACYLDLQGPGRPALLRPAGDDSLAIVIMPMHVKEWPDEAKRAEEPAAAAAAS